MTSVDTDMDRIKDKESSLVDRHANPVVRDAKAKNNYLLLRNYIQNILPMRRMLLETAMHSIERIDSDEFPLGKFSSTEKVKSVFQMDVISGIMLYIEDLVVLSESFRRKIPYYELLDESDKNHDVGKMIGEFFKNLDSISTDEFGGILAYESPKHIDLSNKERMLVKKIMCANITELKHMFVQIGKFGTTHHLAFRRFKHGGAPMVLGSKVQQNGDLPRFDLYTPVLEGPNLFEDIIVIPLSKDVLDGYSIIIDQIQTCLDDLIKNHITCIERNLNGMIPNKIYSQNYLSGEEIKMYEKIINNFYDRHPYDMSDLTHFHYKSKIRKEKIQWYLDLQDFLKKHNRRSEQRGGPSRT